ncbi:sn-glycerol-3-phosphate ABC transporter permease UgpE [Salipiger pacificus]|nr:sn-glycerol-3-phosphate ABC transporter permease UgpE [Alloyangia pacifica]MCA0944964.1 sn-glycerol-3-phosphate ABC transporter permease UgpE [Alloyangia pacifica]
MQKIKPFDHLILILGSLFLCAPVLMALMSSTHTAVDIHSNGLSLLPGGNGTQTYTKVLTHKGGFTGDVTGLLMLRNSLIMGLGFAVGKIALSMMAAYALVYFRFRFATLLFWAIFATLLLPLEVRIMPSYQVMSELHLLNTYTGLIVPLLASATGTFFFRQFFRSVPDELLEAARIDGAGPVKFFIDVLVPLSKTMMAAIFIIMFIYGWNQYLWPLLMTTDESFYTLMRGIKSILQVWVGSQIPDYNEAFALAVLAMIPPVAVVVIFQRMFIKGLTESDK